MTAHGCVHWNELNTHDPKAAMAFYGAVLGWTFQEIPNEFCPSYWIIWSGDARMGGIFEMSNPAFEGIPEHWFTHIAV